MLLVTLGTSPLSSAIKPNLIQVRSFSDEDGPSEGVLHSCSHIGGVRVDIQVVHVDISYPPSSLQWTLVPEVFLDFSSFRDLCSALRGSLAALSCEEKSRDEKNQGRPSAPGYPSLEPLHIHLMIIQRDWNLLNVNWDQWVDTRHENVRLVTLSRAAISYISGKKIENTTWAN